MKRSSKKSNSQVTEKLLSDYQKTITEYVKKNCDLENEIDDLKQSITINQDIIDTFLNNDSELKNEVKTAINKYISLLDEKAELELRCSKVEQIINNIPTEIQLLQNENEEMKKEIFDKINQIEKVEKEIAKERKNALFKDAREEVYVIAPTRENLELYNKVKMSNSIEEAKDKKQLKILEFVIKSLETEISKQHSRFSSNAQGKAFSEDFQIENIDEDNDTSSSIEEEDIENDKNDSENECNSEGNENETPGDIQAQIDKSQENLIKLKENNNNYKIELERCKKIYKELKIEISQLNKIIKKSSVSTQDTSSVVKQSNK